MSGSTVGQLEQQVINTLLTISDPELPVNIYELGLVYEVEINDTGDVHIIMTLTSVGCPVGDAIPLEVERRVAAIPGVHSVKVDLTFEPPWSREMMSEAARLQLDMW